MSGTNMLRCRARERASGLTQGRIRQLFEYTDAGLVWKLRPRSDFATHQAWRTTNGKYVGKLAGSLCSEGYVTVGIDSRRYKLHRIVWLYHHGRWPVGDIDHINHDRTDNRIENLRDVPRHINAKNNSPQAGRSGDIVGVTPTKHGKFIARIGAANRDIYLGTFSTFDAAIKARRSAESAFGFHPNHGASANDL